MANLPAVACRCTGVNRGLTDGIVVRIGATTNFLPSHHVACRAGATAQTEPPPGLTVAAALLTLVQLSVGVACAGGVGSAPK